MIRPSPATALLGLITMANLTKEQIDKLPLADFGEPDTRNFHIVDQNDVNSAADLIGKARNPGMTKRRIIRIAKRKGFSIPEAWKSEAKFGMDDMTDGDIRDSLGWAVADLTPDARHRVLHVMPMAKKVVYTDGKDNYSQDFDFDENGNPELKGTQEKVNVKRRTHIEPVSMSASFSAGAVVGDMVECSGKMFELGVYPDKKFSLNEAEFDAMAHKFSRIDLDLEHSGIKSLLGLPFGYMESAARDGKNVGGKVWVGKWLSDLVGGVVNTSFQFDPVTKDPIGCALVLDPRITDAEVVAAFSRARDGQRPTDQTKPMTLTLTQKIANLFKKHPEAAADVGFSQEDVTTEATQPITDNADLLARVARLEADNVRLSADSVAFSANKASDVSVQFAKHAIAEGKFFPYEEEWLVATFSEALKADGGGVARFGFGGSLHEGPMCKRLREGVEKRPKHAFGANVTGTEKLTVVFSDPVISQEAAQDAQKNAYLAGTGTKDRVEAARKGA